MTQPNDGGPAMVHSFERWSHDDLVQHIFDLSDVLSRLTVHGFGDMPQSKLQALALGQTVDASNARLEMERRAGVARDPEDVVAMDLVCMSEAGLLTVEIGEDGVPGYAIEESMREEVIAMLGDEAVSAWAGDRQGPLAARAKEAGSDD